MALHDFQLEGGFIELNTLLTLLALAPSGGGADDVRILATTARAIAP